MRWLRQTLESFIPESLENIIKMSELDGREMGNAHPEKFDKVLLLHCDKLMDSQWYHCCVVVVLFVSICFQIQFLSTLGNSDKVSLELVFIWWSAWFKGSGNIGIGDYRMFFISRYLKRYLGKGQILLVSVHKHVHCIVLIW